MKSIMSVFTICPYDAKCFTNSFILRHILHMLESVGCRCEVAVRREQVAPARVCVWVCAQLQVADVCRCVLSSCHCVAGVFWSQVEPEHMWQVEQILSVNAERATTGHETPSRPWRWVRHRNFPNVSRSGGNIAHLWISYKAAKRAYTC